MRQKVGYLILSVALSGGGTSPSFSQTIRAQLIRVQATPHRVDAPDVASFNLKYDVRLANESKDPVKIPKIRSGDTGASRMVLLGIQGRRADGTWAHIVQSSYYDTGSMMYAPCTTLAPGAEAEFPNLRGSLLLLKDQLAGLGSKPTVRFVLMMFCRQQDGEVVSATVTTDSLDLRLPSSP